MAAVEITISGVLYDKYNRTQQNVVLIGEASLTGLGVGGGPIPPGPGGPVHIWGPTDPRPTPPIYWPGFPGGGGGAQPPGGDHIWGPTDPRPTPPIYWPGFPGGGGGGGQLPPGVELPPPPNPGDPTTPVPPPAGSSGWPVQGMVPPPFIVVNYPGIGPVVVAPPATSQTPEKG